jgi:predicted  nucleic acid-binding Zn-ribbon protein
MPKKKYSFMQVKPDSKIPKKVASKGSQKSPPKAKKNDPLKTRKYWQDLKNQLQNEIISLTSKINQDQLRLNQLNTDLTSMSLPSRRASLKNEIDKLSARLNQDKSKLKSLQNELENLYAKARKAGIPPGWLR